MGKKIADKCMTAPLDDEGNTDYEQLEVLWMTSEIKTLKEFKTAYRIEDKNFTKKTRGWSKKRNSLKTLLHEKITDSEESEKRLKLLWSYLLYKLCRCSSYSDQNESEIKHITAIARVLKTVHAGLGNLSLLDKKDTPAAFFLEGVNIEEL